MNEWDDEDQMQGSLRGGHFQCPYCGELVEPPLDEDLAGDLVWDCEVCCRPWLIRISVDHEGTKHVSVERA